MVELMALADNSDLCSYIPNGCQLPFVPGHYGGVDSNDAMVIEFPMIPEIILPFLSGEMNVKVNIHDGNDNKLFCLETTLAIA